MSVKLGEKSREEIMREMLAAHGDKDECLIWPYRKTPLGYADVYFQKKMQKIHRVAFYLKHGHWPEPMGLHVKHCTSRACFAPAHIYEGDQFQNMHDMMELGRHVRPDVKGSKHGMSKLTEEKVALIKAERGKFHREIAEKFGVTRETVSYILEGRTWTHVAPATHVEA